ncbi:MAG: BlaI/MecI/CopY family transcriptional regulator [Clostridiales bacterium]|nr:BlaI/MecI/CopY family transcriptional regulator [Clostridiales bacterium]
MNNTSLTNAERKIMEIIWKHKELSNIEITNIADEDTSWSRHTVKTYTNSLTEKGMLGVNQISQRKIKYYAIVSKEKYLASATGNHLRKNYKKLSYMVAGLINNEQVSDEEIRELQQLIRDYKENMDA